MNTITTSVAVSMIQAGISLEEAFPGGVTVVPDGDQVAVPTSKPAKKSQPEGLKAAKKHCYEARMARRQDPTRKGGAGMTKAEKSALYAELIAAGKDPRNKKVWNAACKKARGL